jgi:hypothetical protein
MTLYLGGGQKNVPRQCTHVPLVEREVVSEGEAIGSEKGKGLRIKEVGQGLHCL